MHKRSRWLLPSAIFLLLAVDCFAGQIKAYIAPFTVTGTANRDELKLTLQNLLMSRLSNDSVMAIESAEIADISVKGSYIAFGKVFSIDAVAKSREGKVLIRAFEQGESQEELLQAVGKLAKTLVTGIEKNYIQHEVIQATAAVAPGVEPVAPPKDIVRVETVKNPAGSAWISQKLEGELTGVAIGRNLGNNEREVFISGSRSLKYYRMGKELTLLAEVTLPGYQKILGIDSADLDKDGVPEIYLTVMSNDDLASEVWSPEGTSLKKIAGKLPYYFRAFTFQGKSRQIYAQQMSRTADYYGDLYEVTKKGSVFDIANPLKVPRGANIFNTGMITTKEGKNCFVVLNQDRYLLVFDEKGAELWRSSDKYGGSENFITKEDLQDIRLTGSPLRKIFLEQRITISKDGEVIVPKNDGFFIVGNSRSFTKNSLFAFTWNGLMLDELWHTKPSQNYLSDYVYDEEQKQLLLLEVVKKEGLYDKGASALSIKRVE